MNLADHEKEILEEIYDWEVRLKETSLIDAAGSVVTKPLDLLLRTKPAQGTLERMSESIYRTLNSLHTVASRTISIPQILAGLRAKGVNVEALEEVKEQDIRRLDAVGKSFTKSHTVMATLQGGGLGAGGLMFMIADIPALLTVNFRMIQQVAICYGYDPTPEHEVDIALKIIQIASSMPEERKSGMLELDSALESVRVMGKKAGLFASAIAIKALAQRMSHTLAKRKLGQLMPLVGIGIGAGVNYQFTNGVGETAYMVYRKRFLLDKKELQSV